MVKLMCLLVGVAGHAFEMEVDGTISVSALKKLLMKRKGKVIDCDDEDELRLLFAKKDNKWLPDDDAAVGALKKGEIPPCIRTILKGEELMETRSVNDVLEENEMVGELAPKLRQIHLLVDGTGAKEVTGKRKRVKSSDPSPLEDLRTLATIGQQLDRDTDLAVGNLVNLPKESLKAIFTNGLYMRQEYWDLHCMIQQEFASKEPRCRILVTGSPGIGKSVFGVFLLFLFMTERKDVAYRRLGDSVIYFFTWSSEHGYEISETPVSDRSYEALFNGNAADGALSFNSFSHVYVFASPRTVNYNDFVKIQCFKVYMNRWSKDERQKFADSIGLEDQDEWFQRFNLVGGKPRFLFSPSESFAELVQHVKADIPWTITELKDQVRLFEQRVFNDRMKHLVFHFYRNDAMPSIAYLSYSSLAVEAIVSARYDIYSASEIREMLQTPSLDLQSWRGKEPENVFLQELPTNEFCMRSLDGSTTGTDMRLGPFNAKLEVIEAPSDVKEKLVLYIPLSKTFPAIDALLIVPQHKLVLYVQSTVVTRHPPSNTSA